MQVEIFNKLVNPLYPFATFSKEWLYGSLESLIHSDSEKILMAAHVLLGKNNGLLVISNRRLIIYQIRSNSLLSRAFRFGWGEAKGGILGVIPVVGDLLDAKETASMRLDSLRQMVNRKAAKRKEAKAEREELKKLAQTLHLPDSKLLDHKKYTLVFQDNWHSFDQLIYGVRWTKNQMQFELAPETKALPAGQESYRSLFKKPVNFYHQDIGFILSSLILPHRELLKKWGWNLYFDGENMLMTKEQIEDPALEEVLEEVKKVNFFGAFSQAIDFPKVPDQPWLPEPPDQSEIKLTVNLEAFEEAVHKKGKFQFRKSQILPPLDDDELSKKLHSFIETLKSESWLTEVNKVYLSQGSSPQFAILLAQLQPAQEGLDEWFWFIIGDLPQTYLNARYFPSTASAVDYYFKELTKQVKGVQSNKDASNSLPLINGVESELAVELEQKLPVLHHFLLQRQLDLLG